MYPVDQKNLRHSETKLQKLLDWKSHPTAPARISSSSSHGVEFCRLYAELQLAEFSCRPAKRTSGVGSRVINRKRRSRVTTCYVNYPGAAVKRVRQSFGRAERGPYYLQDSFYIDDII